MSKAVAAVDAKVKCKLCDYEDHILVSHVKKKHSMDAVEYIDKHGGLDAAPLWSAYGYKYIVKYSKGGSAVAMMARPRRKIQVGKLFPDFGKRTKTKPRGEVEIFDTPGPLTPQLDENYVFPEEQTLDIITILEKKKRNRIYLKGWSGTGKTQLIHNLAAKFNAELMECNLDSFQQRSTLIGHFTVKNGETVWEYGIIPTAMMTGAWLLLNEIDTADPHTLNVLKPMLEDPSRLTIMENNGEVITAHPDFRPIATANTWARGDTTGLYSNTMTQSDADARRWSARILLDYMDADVEQDMLMRYFKEELDDDEPALFVQVANKARESFKAGKIDKTFSPAELINWVENYLVTGKTVHHAARISFLNACEPDVQTAIGEMIVAVFGKEPGSGLKDD